MLNIFMILMLRKEGFCQEMMHEFPFEPRRIVRVIGMERDRPLLSRISEQAKFDTLFYNSSVTKISLLCSSTNLLIMVVYELLKT